MQVLDNSKLHLSLQWPTALCTKVNNYSQLQKPAEVSIATATRHHIDTLINTEGGLLDLILTYTYQHVER